MMDRAAALWIAIDLRHAPSRAKELRSKPLPDGVLTLLHIAAGDKEVTSEACARVRRSPEVVREAAAFFIEQILLFPGADSYRVLGAAPVATYAELRRNMALLLRWLHPDVDPQGERAIFTQRVTRAWSDLKSDESRAAYDRSRRISATKKAGAKARAGSRHPSSISRQPHYVKGNFVRKPVDLRLADAGILRRMFQRLLGRVAQ